MSRALVWLICIVSASYSVDLSLGVQCSDTWRLGDGLYEKAWQVAEKKNYHKRIIVDTFGTIFFTINSSGKSLLTGSDINNKTGVKEIYDFKAENVKDICTMGREIWFWYKTSVMAWTPISKDKSLMPMPNITDLKEVAEDIHHEMLFVNFDGHLNKMFYNYYNGTPIITRYTAVNDVNLISIDEDNNLAYVDKKNRVFLHKIDTLKFERIPLPPVDFFVSITSRGGRGYIYVMTAKQLLEVHLEDKRVRPVPELNGVIAFGFNIDTVAFANRTGLFTAKRLKDPCYNGTNTTTTMMTTTWRSTTVDVNKDEHQVKYTIVGRMKVGQKSILYSKLLPCVVATVVIFVLSFIELLSCVNVAMKASAESHSSDEMNAEDDVEENDSIESDYAKKDK